MAHEYEEDNESYGIPRVADADVKVFLSSRKYLSQKDIDSLRHPSIPNGAETRYLRSKINVRDDFENRFEVFVRVNNEIPGDFSVGVIYRPEGYDKGIVLRRYNGNSHSHTNKIEREKIVRKFHIHEATERYQDAGYKAEDYATISTGYSTYQEAIDRMIDECNLRVKGQFSLTDAHGEEFD